MRKLKISVWALPIVALVSWFTSGIVFDHFRVQGVEEKRQEVVSRVKMAVPDANRVFGTGFEILTIEEVTGGFVDLELLDLEANKRCRGLVVLSQDGADELQVYGCYPVHGDVTRLYVHGALKR